jgi:hypothetical protein
MYLHLIPLETRPQGAGIVASEGDMPFATTVDPGCTVTLRFREVRILVQVLELEQDQFYVGQVIDFDGTLEPEVQGVNIGSYLRFRDEHIFSCTAP